MEIFTRPCPESWSTYFRPFAEAIYLPTLPLHIHQVIGSAIFYQAVYLYISPIITKIFLPRIYNSFPKRTQVNWDVHVVSFIQSVFICALALWVMVHPERAPGYGSDREAALFRVFGYTVTGGAIQGYAVGYFIWDLFICIYHFKIMGLGFVAHAISALAVYSWGFRTFVNYYAPIFILFELSSPFLNIHWFCDKLGLTGGRLQLVNGICLITTFFCCRLIWGVYSSVMVFIDIFSIYANPPGAGNLTAQDLLAEEALADKSVEVHPFAGKSVPLWLAFIYLSSNLTLNGLNFYWFSRMIQTITSRFTTPQEKDRKHMSQKVTVEGTEVDIGETTASAIREGKALKKRLGH
ncbi:DUF887-domain-containing protein [Ascodesmis nigricans]|uniref:DUF887-domain-containing protein n=1 Tax=Ascodesmis nigricans TaxID=341454 RepID=A0A4S2MYI8_9PEZI|nr:DUF887-domain-containing protein [Ascodesmis nigricans]